MISMLDQRLIGFGRNGLFASASAAAAVSLVTTSWPSRKSAAETTVFAPSAGPIFTCIGLTNRPVFNQMVPSAEFPSFCDASLGGSSSDALVRYHGATSASDDGIQRNAAFGTSNAFDSLAKMKRTFAVRYGNRI